MKDWLATTRWLLAEVVQLGAESLLRTVRCGFTAFAYSALGLGLFLPSLSQLLFLPEAD
jgi:hypothetical protein